MKIELESTAKIIEIETGSDAVPARVWEGKTASGIPVFAFITRIAVKKDADTGEFEKELQSHKPPSAVIENFPLRIIL